jgi:excisionase family DNA binding protein
LLSIAEAAELLRCKPQRVYDLRSSRRLPRTVEGGRAVVRRTDVERLISEDG